MRTADETGQAPAAKRQRIQMPDEYLPPNSVLFVQNLPDGTTSDDLRELFEQCVWVSFSPQCLTGVAVLTRLCTGVRATKL